jgi:hypothetical protein
MREFRVRIYAFACHALTLTVLQLGPPNRLND